MNNTLRGKLTALIEAANMKQLCPMGEPPFIADLYNSGEGWYVIPELWDEESCVSFADCERYADDEDPENRARHIAYLLNSHLPLLEALREQLDSAKMRGGDWAIYDTGIVEGITVTIAAVLDVLWPAAVAQGIVSDEQGVR